MRWPTSVTTILIVLAVLTTYSRASSPLDQASRQHRPLPLNSLCQAPKKPGHSPLYGCPANTTFVSQRHPVAAHRTISSALASLPDDGSTQTILLDAGHYHERVLVTRSSPLILAGITPYPHSSSFNRVRIWQSSYVNQSDPHNTLRNCDAVVLGVGTSAPQPLVDFKAYNIDLVQHQYLNGREVTDYQLGPSAALCVENANASFYSCRFESYQDTIYVGPNAQAFFWGGVVKGMTDQLYGSGKAWFERVSLLSRACGGGITAWRGDPKDPTVGVYVSNSQIARSNDASTVKDLTRKCHLGRPWDRFSHAVFLNTTMEDIVAREGFKVWSWKESDFDAKTTRFEEFNSSGPGGDVRGRDRRLQRILTEDEAKKITIRSVFGDTSWIDWRRVWTWRASSLLSKVLHICSQPCQEAPSLCK